MTPAPSERRHRRSRRLIAATAAVAAPVLIWIVAVPVLGHPLRLTDPARHATITIGVSAVSALAAALGWAVLAALERLTRHARALWVTLAALALLISFVPLSGSGLDLPTRAVLAGMHLAVAVILVPALSRTSTRPAHPRVTIAG